MCSSDLNGYHLGVATSDGGVAVWDLRKLKMVDSIVLSSMGESQTTICHSLRFCPLGKYLAMGTSSGRIHIGTVKELKQVHTLLSSTNTETGIVNGMLWGDHAQTFISCNDSERVVRFWGIPAKSP